jgi:stearoyl-CoA desaturase (delta-9 desaturase)
MAKNHPSEKINWVNTLFLTLCPLVAIAGTVLLCVYSVISWKTWLLLVVLTGITGVAITGGYHRLFSHSTYKAPAPVRLLFLLFAAASFEGSVFEWCSDHRIHHRHADTEQDPYNINRGFWYAHIGWLIKLDTSKRDFSNIPDLTSDPLCRFQHRFYVPLAVLMGFVLPTAIAWCWGAPLAGLLVAGALRITLNHHFTFFINSLCHTLGKRPYSKEQTARDHWLAAIFTYGEGYHNFHHKFPLDYRNGVRAHQFDPTKWLIWCMAKVGLARDLKRVRAHRIAKFIVQTEPESTNSLVQQAKERLMGLIAQLEQLEREYLESLKTIRCKVTLKNYRKQLRQLRRKLSQDTARWSRLVRQYA